MTNKEKLVLTINEADCLLADTSVFTLLGVNNPCDGIWDKIPGKGYYLSALAIFTVFGLYSRIYFTLITKHRTPTEEQLKALAELKRFVMDNKLKPYVIIKKPDSLLASEQNCFEEFMKFLDQNGLNFGLSSTDYASAWKQIRNMLTHMTFSLHEIGGKHILSNNRKAVEQMGLPNYKQDEVLLTIRNNYHSTEVFQNIQGKFRFNTVILLAYMPLVKELLLQLIDSSEEEQLDYAFRSIKDIVDRQLTI